MMLLAKILTFFIPGKHRRREARLRMRNKLYGRKVRRVAKSVGKNVWITDVVTVNHDTVIGDDTVIQDLSILGYGGVTIGSHVVFGPHVTIQTMNHDYKGDSLPFNNQYIIRPVSIDDCAWIGMNVQILPGTHIGEGAIIQMGAVVHGDIPPCAIAGGNPAKVFAYRDKDKYYRLKAESKFHKWS